MNFILVCLFALTVGSLASKIQVQKDIDKSEALDSNAESLGKRSSALSIAQDDAPTITKRGRCYLTKFWRGYYVGTGRVHSGFFPKIRLMNYYAYLCKVKIHLTSSFRKDNGGSVSGAIVTPSKISNHYVGHAIDMNLIDTASGKFCNSRCLADASKQPAGVKCFISKIQQNSNLRWGGDFRNRDVVHIDDGLNRRSFSEWKALYKSLQTNC